MCTNFFHLCEIKTFVHYHLYHVWPSSISVWPLVITQLTDNIFLFSTKNRQISILLFSIVIVAKNATLRDSLSFVSIDLTQVNTASKIQRVEKNHQPNQSMNMKKCAVRLIFVNFSGNIEKMSNSTITLGCCACEFFSPLY